MVSLIEKTTIPFPPDQVWPLLSDPALVASCIPGTEVAPDQGDGLWRGSIRIKFGPTVAVFRGEASLVFDHGARTCVIEGRGIDGRGASRALASGVVKATGSEATELTIEGSFTVSGPLETFANAGGVHVARALLGEFAANVARLVADRHVPVPPVDAAALAPALPVAAPSPVPAVAAELNAASLLSRAFFSWWRELLGKREDRR